MPPSRSRPVLDLETVTDMYFNACLLDYTAADRKWTEWTEKLAGVSDIHLTGKNTDLRLSCEGRAWGTNLARGNMPGAEASCAPLVDTVNGHIYFENPGVLGGRLMHDLYLEWKDGDLVKASASTNEDYLHKILNTDKGASKIGEFAIGFNENLTSFTNDILWDEKMYGTMHIALGRAYARRGGINKSAIHWDIIKDLRQEGELVVDGQTIIKNGKLLFKGNGLGLRKNRRGSKNDNQQRTYCQTYGRGQICDRLRALYCSTGRSGL